MLTKMSLMDFKEFCFLCQRAGFKNLGEVDLYCKLNCITCWQLFNELDEMFTPEYLKEKLPMRNYKHVKRPTLTYDELLVLALIDPNAKQELLMRLTKLLNESKAEELNINFNPGKLIIRRDCRGIKEIETRDIPANLHDILKDIVNKL